MKKFLVLFVCLAALAAGSAFALDLPDAIKIPGLTVTGDVRTGLRVAGGTYKDWDEDTTEYLDPEVYGYSDDLDDGKPFRAQLQLVWERDKLGVKTRFRYNPNADGTLAKNLANLNTTVNKAFVYANLFDNKARVSVGKGVDGAWTIPWSNFNTNNGFDDADGVKVEVKPISGLSFGFHYGNNLITNALDNGAVTDQNNTWKRLVVGAKYGNDTLKVTAALGSNVWELNNADFLPSGGNHGVLFELHPHNNIKPGTSNLMFGASFTPSAIPLTVNLAGTINGLGSKTIAKAYKDELDEDIPEDQAYKDGKYNPYWVFRPKINAEFGVNDALTVGLTITDFYFADGYYTAKSNEDAAKDRGFGLLFPITFNPYVAYAINDDITVQADINLKINTDGSDVFGFGIKPSAEFSLGSGAKFVVYDEITFYGKSKGGDSKSDSYDEEWAAEHSGAAGAAWEYANTTTNTLQFDFVWTF